MRFNLNKFSNREQVLIFSFIILIFISALIFFIYWLSTKNQSLEKENQNIISRLNYIESIPSSVSSNRNLYSDNISILVNSTSKEKNIQIDRNRKKNASIHIQSSNTSEEQVKKIPDDSPTPEDTLIIKQNLAELLSYVKQLKPHYQDVINLRYFQEMSYNEIAQELTEPLSNIKVRLLRAKKLLAEIILKKKTQESLV